MKKYIMKSIAALTALASVAACTDLDPVWYSEVTPETFFKTKNDVYSAMGRPFTHLYSSEMRGDGVGFWFLQELCADQFAVIQKEQKWTQLGHLESLYQQCVESGYHGRRSVARSD